MPQTSSPTAFSPSYSYQNLHLTTSSANAFAFLYSSHSPRETYAMFDDLHGAMRPAKHIAPAERHSSVSGTSAFAVNSFGMLASSHTPREMYLIYDEFALLVHASHPHPSAEGPPSRRQKRAGWRRLLCGKK